MENFSNLDIGAVVVLVIAICEAAKRAGLLNRYIPLLAVILGLAGGIYFGGVSWLAVASGVMLGLSSSGLYDLGKKTVLNK